MKTKELIKQLPSFFLLFLFYLNTISIFIDFESLLSKFLINRIKIDFFLLRKKSKSKRLFM